MCVFVDVCMHVCVYAYVCVLACCLFVGDAGPLGTHTGHRLASVHVLMHRGAHAFMLESVHACPSSERKPLAYLCHHFLNFGVE